MRASASSESEILVVEDVQHDPRAMCRGSQRRWYIASTAIGLVMLVGTMLAPSLTAPPEITAGTLRVFESIPIRIPVTNRSWGLSARLEKVSTSCGCTRVDPIGLALAPRSTVFATARVEPRTHDRRISSDVYLVDSYGNKTTVHITGDVVEPFSGWPDRLVAQHDSRGYWKAVLAPEYRGRVTAATVLPVGGRRMDAAVDEATGEILLFRDGDIPTTDGAEISLAFNPFGSFNWTGWLILR